MKRCPQCRRDYHDETLLYCLEDGTALVQGSVSFPDEPATAILNDEIAVPSEAKTRVIDSAPTTVTRSNRKSIIAGVIGIVLMTALGVGSYLYYARGSAKQIDSIAVMPFVNESGNPDIEYLSDGMTETLLDSLSQLPGLNVKARSTVFRYKEKDVDAQSVGRELGVRAILNGRLVQRGDGLSLFLELVDTGTGDRIWGGQYDRKQSELVLLQSEIARDVANKLRSKLSGEEVNRVAKSDTANPDAYGFYLQGRFFWNKRRIGTAAKAIGSFQQAIDLDPNYAKAWAGLADVLVFESDVVPVAERKEKARAAALKALSLQNDLAEAHTALANIMLRLDLDFSGAEREFSQALKLDPKWTDTYLRYGELFTFLGRYEEAFTKFRQGLEIEPFHLPLNTSYGHALIRARRYDEAIAQLRKVVEMDPSHRSAHVALVMAYSLKGMYPEAVEHRIIALKLSNQDDWAEKIREGFANDGWRGVLKAELAHFAEQPYSPDRLPHYNKAYLLAGLGEKDGAFAELEKSLENPEMLNFINLKVDPRFDPLRDDPRFPALLKRIGFPD